MAHNLGAGQSNPKKIVIENFPEWEAIQNKAGPLNILDLPVDILRLIVKEINHTNDLASLALTNSTLYKLAIPQIYTRFDIVWPDSTAPATESKNVDALTYGLSTLCLGSKFAQRKRWLRRSASKTTVTSTSRADNTQSNTAPSLRLVDNQYAKFTRKFSLGNGPPEWTSEYKVDKESGKMLGTLVALAVAKMVNLETFVWDMPTGVLSDVFMALASAQDQTADGVPKLEKLWIRWHDNHEIRGPPAASIPSTTSLPSLVIPPLVSHGAPIGIAVPSDSMTAVSPIKYSQSSVEYPTFSIMPPVKSLTVLNIDELSYLDEMAILIEKSISGLQELRVGIAKKARGCDFSRPWDGVKLQQVDHDADWPGENRIGEKRLGGVLGVLVGRIYDLRRKPRATTLEEATHHEDLLQLYNGVQENAAVEEAPGEALSSTNTAPYAAADGTDASVKLASRTREHPVGYTTPCRTGNDIAHTERKPLNGKLRLRTLELETVALSVQVCTKAIDWSVLTSLTLLDCPYHEYLWKALRRQYQPTSPSHGSSANTPTQYHMSLKQIHTDMTSSQFISFLRETLAPNSLEVLFLQERRLVGPPGLSLGQIFKGAIRRHKSSLTKLLLGSSDQIRRSPPSSTNWVLTTEIVEYITSGRMGNLKELGVGLKHKDWHLFLQRLPNIPQLHALYIPAMMEDHLSGVSETKEYALQVVDIVTLRPEIQLCYLGIGCKCFEILEASRSDGGHASSDLGNNGHVGGHGMMANGGVDEDDEEDEGSDEDEGTDGGDGEDANDDNTNSSPSDNEDDLTEGSEVDSDADSTDLHEHGASPGLRMREILFYDDKVAIFKARHGTL
ncbi:hypothetical protein F4778DRAFT_793181 [Xylariomycetidae sp. FL2044]|nr:hypothetical protein F4778DRAFT_793181 [Xylariomycetidae sp. FL2044]